MREVHRALGIAPTSRGFGYAVIEDGELLVDYGLTHQRPPDEERLLERARTLIHRHRPDTFVVRDLAGSRLGQRSRSLLGRLAELGEEEGLQVYRPTLEEVVRHFASDGLTKHDRARAVAERFPQLRPKLPSRRKPWESEDEWMAVFGAVGSIVVRLSLADGRSSRSSKW